MAKDPNKPKKPKKKRWYSYLADAYRISKRTYSWTPLAIWGTVLAFIAIGFILGFTTGAKIMWPLMFTMLGLTLSLVILTQLVKRASFSQIDGMPGAAGAVMDQIKRGWVINREPVRFNARTQDLIYRAIGRPGVVIISEGPANRVAKLIDEERKAIKRVAPSAPIEVIRVGNEEGQVPLSKLEKTMKKLPKKVTDQEVAAIAQRLDAIQTNAMPIPKGIDPFKARPNRRSMRG